MTIYDSNNSEHRAARSKAPLCIEGDGLGFLGSILWDAVAILVVLGALSAAVFLAVLPFLESWLAP